MKMLLAVLNMGMVTAKGRLGRGEGRGEALVG